MREINPSNNISNIDFGKGVISKSLIFPAQEGDADAAPKEISS